MSVYRALLLVLCLTVGLGASSVPASIGSNAGYRLLIYYGSPEGINGVWDVGKAAEIFAEYDYIVLGAGLEESKHSYHDSTIEVIRITKELHPEVVIFGYVDLGVTTDNHSMAVLQDKTRKWKELGADGIFLDDAGYDYHVSRSRLNETVKFIHNNGMSAFVNAWRPDDIMGSSFDRIYNPRMQVTLLDERDYYLLEDFMLPIDVSNPMSESVFRSKFKTKMDKSLYYRNKLGIRLMSVSVIDYRTFSESAVRKFFRMNEVGSGVFSLDAYGVAPTHFSAAKPHQNEVRQFPYMENYMDYYDRKGKVIAKYNNQDFARASFRVHSVKGLHYYNYPIE